MNIFYLDDDIKKCAQYHCDKHVVKMILESVQILCTVVNEHGGKAPYKSTHKNHPCVVWTSESLDNWRWLKQFALELNKEFQYRFNHTEPHKSIDMLQTLSEPAIKAIGVTERPQVVPEELKVDGDSVTAYRQCYLAEKRDLLTYTKRKMPDWIK